VSATINTKQVASFNDLFEFQVDGHKENDGVTIVDATQNNHDD